MDKKEKYIEAMVDLIQGMKKDNLTDGDTMGVLAFTIAHTTHHSTNPKTYYLALKTLVDGMLTDEVNSYAKEQKKP